jgi:hydroxymethylpyrimidine pyrophosphatase-like HAD family hydrolase
VAEQTKPVYVFDLDGVITDPKNSQVNREVTGAMRQLLAEKTYLAVNTGRSFEWVEQNLIERLGPTGNDGIFARFIAVCEKGGEAIVRQDNRWSVSPSEFALPHDMYEATKTIFDQNSEQLKSMFWDDTKRTMATIEKVPTARLDTFHVEQGLLVRKLSAALATHGVRVDPTTIATDVESPAAGKHAGAQLIYEWVQSLGDVTDRSFISFGDSISDYEMARYFAAQNARSTFVYVGMPTDKIVHDDQVTFISTTAQYAAGTMEFLATDR